MRTKVFVSYRKEDEKYFRKIRKWAIREDFGEFDIFMTSSFDKGMRTQSGKLIKGRLDRKIHESKFIVVIVGDNNESHPWRKLDEMAAQKNKKRFYMRIPYTSDPLPEEFEDFQQLAYNPNAIEKLMRDWVTLYGEDEPIEPYEPKYKPRYSRRSSSGGYRSGNNSYRPRYDRDNRDNRNRDGGGGYNRDRNRSYDRPYNNDRRYDRPSYNRPYNNDRDRDRDRDYSRDRNRDRDYNRDRDRNFDKPKKKYIPKRHRTNENYNDDSYKDSENNNSNEQNYNDDDQY